MRPTPQPPRLLPLLAGSAAGSLGPEDLTEIGISAAAIDIVELAVGLGLDRVERLGGLARLTGWEGPLVAVARMALVPPAATGWRARALPELLAEGDGVLELRSALDGGRVRLVRTELAAWARRLGAEPATSVAGEGVEVVQWDGGEPPPAALLVTGQPQEQAREGRFWDGSTWVEVVTANGESSLVEGCGCRACSIAGRGYLAHLWAMREITAEHLLGWHNLYQLRRMVEG
jgi:queuine/archaeosine tRNA-ribosyltransferase